MYVSYKSPSTPLRPWVLLRPRSSHFTERPLAKNIFTTNVLVLVLVLVHIHYQHHGGTIAGLLEVHPD